MWQTTFTNPNASEELFSCLNPTEMQHFTEMVNSIFSLKLHWLYLWEFLIQIVQVVLYI